MARIQPQTSTLRCAAAASILLLLAGCGDDMDGLRAKI
jgi:hypothetical protein